MTDERSVDDLVAENRRFKLLLAIALAFLLGIGFIAIKAWAEKAPASAGWIELILSLSIELLGSLITAIALYLVLVRRALPATEHRAREGIEDIKRTIVSLLPGPSTHAEAVAGFYDDYDDVDWQFIIGGARTIDIVVSYFSGWVRRNAELFRMAFEQGCLVRVFLTDPDDGQAMAVTAGRFPHQSYGSVLEKVLLTGVLIDNLRIDAQATNGRVEVRFYRGVLNYSAVRVNGQRTVLSVYEHFPKAEDHIRSPAFVLDETKAPRLHHYWESEIKGFMEHSTLVPVSAVRERAKLLMDQRQQDQPSTNRDDNVRPDRRRRDS